MGEGQGRAGGRQGDLQGQGEPGPAEVVQRGDNLRALLQVERAEEVPEGAEQGAVGRGTLQHRADTIEGA